MFWRSVPTTMRGGRFALAITGEASILFVRFSAKAMMSESVTFVSSLMRCEESTTDTVFVWPKICGIIGACRGELVAQPESMRAERAVPARMY